MEFFNQQLLHPRHFSCLESGDVPALVFPGMERLTRFVQIIESAQTAEANTKGEKIPCFQKPQGFGSNHLYWILPRSAKYKTPLQTDFFKHIVSKNVNESTHVHIQTFCPKMTRTNNPKQPASCKQGSSLKSMLKELHTCPQPPDTAARQCTAILC